MPLTRRGRACRNFLPLFGTNFVEIDLNIGYQSRDDHTDEERKEQHAFARFKRDYDKDKRRR